MSTQTPVQQRLSEAITYKSPLHQMTQTTPTCLWNDSAAISELTYCIEHGGVGATCNPVIVLEAVSYTHLTLPTILRV